MYLHERCFHGFLLWTEVNDQCDKIAVDRRSYHEYVYCTDFTGTQVASGLCRRCLNE